MMSGGGERSEGYENYTSGFRVSKLFHPDRSGSVTDSESVPDSSSPIFFRDLIDDYRAIVTEIAGKGILDNVDRGKKTGYSNGVECMVSLLNDCADDTIYGTNNNLLEMTLEKLESRRASLSGQVNLNFIVDLSHALGELRAYEDMLHDLNGEKGKLKDEVEDPLYMHVYFEQPIAVYPALPELSPRPSETFYELIVMYRSKREALENTIYNDLNEHTDPSATDRSRLMGEKDAYKRCSEYMRSLVIDPTTESKLHYDERDPKVESLLLALSEDQVLRLFASTVDFLRAENATLNAVINSTHEEEIQNRSRVEINTNIIRDISPKGIPYDEARSYYPLLDKPE